MRLDCFVVAGLTIAVVAVLLSLAEIGDWWWQSRAKRRRIKSLRKH